MSCTTLIAVIVPQHWLGRPVTLLDLLAPIAASLTSLTYHHGPRDERNLEHLLPRLTALKYLTMPLSVVRAPSVVNALADSRAELESITLTAGAIVLDDWRRLTGPGHADANASFRTLIRLAQVVKVERVRVAQTDWDGREGEVRRPQPAVATGLEDLREVLEGRRLMLESMTQQL